MDIDKITQIKYWLKYIDEYRETSCPFNYEEDAWKICLALFPKIKKVKRAHRNICGCKKKCPCTVYGIKKVVAKAEEIINGTKKNLSD